MSTLVKPCRWLPDNTPALRRTICERAHADIGVCELPPGSNRSPAIDDYNRRAGAAVGSYWCASWVWCMWEDAGVPLLDRPARFKAPAVREWVVWAKALKRWKIAVATPAPGDVVVYGTETGVPEHVGIVTRPSPIVCSVEGNTALAGYSRNGVAVDFKPVAPLRVLGYIPPFKDG